MTGIDCSIAVQLQITRFTFIRVYQPKPPSTLDLVVLIRDSGIRRELLIEYHSAIYYYCPAPLHWSEHCYEKSNSN
jgi:hypothetical protein